jgi:hypothetical protein
MTCSVLCHSRLCSSGNWGYEKACLLLLVFTYWG